MPRRPRELLGPGLVKLSKIELPGMDGLSGGHESSEGMPDRPAQEQSGGDHGQDQQEHEEKDEDEGGGGRARFAAVAARRSAEPARTRS